MVSSECRRRTGLLQIKEGRAGVTWTTQLLPECRRHKEAYRSGLQLSLSVLGLLSSPLSTPPHPLCRSAEGEKKKAFAEALSSGICMLPACGVCETVVKVQLPSYTWRS